jgi:3-methylfumaryl-CoA hydratase
MKRMMTSHPPFVEQTDTAHPGPMERLAACTPLLAPLAARPVLPPLWHWLLFLPAAPAADLGPDGHRRTDGLLVHNPDLPARMWAGGRLTLHRQPAVHTQITRRSRILHAKDRQGASGPLRLTTLHHALHDATGPLLEEEQDLVFRRPAPPAPAQPAPPAPQGAVTHTILPDSILLFRFSALTFNAHRIHYDRDYARTAELYPDLVVHGPLQAILLAALLHRAAPAGVLRHFIFRGQRPAFVNRSLSLEAWPDPAQPGLWALQTRDPDGALCMTAQATLEPSPPPGHDPA